MLVARIETPPTTLAGREMAKVLVVDDDPLYLEMVGTMLLRGGHVVVEVRNGRDCLSKLAEERFDVVITDLFMPGQDGLETIAAIRSSGCMTPIIGMTGGLAGATRPYALAMSKMGANAILAKPFSAAELSESLTLAMT